MDEMNSASDSSGRNSLKNSPRGVHTSLEGGLDDVDLLAIGQGSPVKDIVHRVIGKLPAYIAIFIAFSHIF